MSLEFRRMRETQSDYQSLAAITNTCYKNHTYTAEQIVHKEGQHDSKDPHYRHLAFEGEMAVGFAEGGVLPKGAFLEVLVHPEHQGKGVGSRLFELIHTDLLTHNPEQLEVQIREDWTEQEAFYARRGFAKQQPWAQWKLELRDFHGLESDFPPGVHIATFAELGDTPELRQTVFDLWVQTHQELRRDSKPKWSFEQFQGEVFEAFWFRPEAFWLAFEENLPVGIHWVAAYPDDPTVFLEWLGVLPGHRRQGIARALLVRGLEFAQKHGYTVAEANNSLADLEVNGLLERLGFVRHPGYVLMVKRFG